MFESFDNTVLQSSAKDEVIATSYYNRLWHNSTIPSSINKGMLNSRKNFVMIQSGDASAKLTNIAEASGALISVEKRELLIEDILDTSSEETLEDTPGTSFFSRATSINDVPSESSISLECNQSANDVSRCADSSVDSPQNDFLFLMQPYPSHPPSYDELPPGGCSRFPILDNFHENERLPKYSPTVFKIALCSRKQEWVSPYDLSANRSWQKVVLELNSTQVNLYCVSADLENALCDGLLGAMCCLKLPPTDYELHSRYWTQVTTNSDIETYQICKRKALFDSKLCPTQDRNASSHSSPTFDCDQNAQFRQNRGFKQNIIRSFSLQHSKFGLAQDYTKKPNVLRLRLENEQFLIHFSTTEEMLEWHLAFSMGKDVSLDIMDREEPKYRTMPRRRRTTPTSLSVRSQAVDSCARSRLRQYSNTRAFNSILGFSESIGAYFSAAILKQGRQSRDSIPLRLPSPTSLGGENCYGNLEAYDKRASLMPEGVLATHTSVDAEFHCRPPSSNRQTQSINSRHFHTNARYDSSDYHSRMLEENHESEEEFCDLEEETDSEDPYLADPRQSEYLNSAGSLSRKWEPSQRSESKRRQIRNWLKCIRPLRFDDKWANKLMVKPTDCTPLMSYCNSCLLGPRERALLKENSRAIREEIDILTIFSVRKTTAVRKENLSSIIALSKIPNHHLQEFIVGLHRLLPKRA